MAFEEALLVSLAEGASLLRQQGRADEAREIDALIRHHRVSHIKRRAIMGAYGIEVDE